MLFLLQLDFVLYSRYGQNIKQTDVYIFRCMYR